jgi:diguanylate cyclase (GGDEF)-like protein/PAS domain S-box-containing protein
VRPWLAKLQTALIEPAAALQDRERRDTSRLLSAVLLAIAALGAISALLQHYWISQGSDTASWIVAGVLLLLPAYALARRGRVHTASLMAYAVTTLAILGVLLSDPRNPLVDIYLLLPTLLAAIFHRGRRAWLLCGGALAAALLAHGLSEGQLTARELGGWAGAAVVSTLLLLSLCAYRRKDAEHTRRLEHSAQTLKALTDSTADAILVIAHGRHVFCNAAAGKLLGYDTDSLLALEPERLLHADELARVVDIHRRRMRGEEAPPQYETILVHANGEPVAVEVTVAPTHWDREPAAVVFVRDIRARRYAEEAMRKLSRAIDQTAEAVMISDQSGTIEYVNPAFEMMTGYNAEEIVGRPASTLRSGKHTRSFYRRLWGQLLRGEFFTDVFINRRKDGSLYYEEKTITPLRDARGRISHFVATGRDLSERIATQERLHFVANHDTLTELPNRSLFIDRLTQALARGQWRERIIAVLFIDLDGFKYVNDSLGHGVGDNLLIELGRRLVGVLRSGDTVARFGGDEFAVLLDDIARTEDVEELANKLLHALAAPISVGSHELLVTASIGVSLYPVDGDDAMALLKQADTATYLAKEQGKNRVQFYAREMTRRTEERFSLESSLRGALDRDEFRLHYQPIFALGHQRMVGVETLLRWEHPERGLVRPDEFIPLLEETGMIVAVGDWVLRTACAQAQAWQAIAGRQGLRIAVNLSGRQIGPGLAERVRMIINACGLDAGLLELELTESTLMHKVDEVQGVLADLNAAGIALAIDDFGTGYSSLSYLKRFPIQRLKIDRSFIDDCPDDADDVSIVRATVAMARSLKMEITAEGVETERQLDFLQALGCDLVQGYLLGRPVPAPEIERRLLEQAPRTSSPIAGMS